MNFLVSKNSILISQYWPTLLEHGESLLLSDFSELEWRALTAKNGLILLDPKIDAFPGMTGITNLKRSNPNIKVMIVSTDLTNEEELAALAGGAIGCCGPDLLPEKIRHIFATVEDGGVWISSSALPHLLQRLKRLETLASKDNKKTDNTANQEGIDKLTPREREIARLVAKGDCNKIIARDLSITDRTVKAHLSIVFRKLNIKDRLQLALLANKHSL